MQFVFHIGAGKTGTSSIQSTLRAGLERLESAHIMYLGLILEHAPAKLYDWQAFGATHVFHSLPIDTAVHQLYEVLKKTLSIAKEKGTRKIVWSSESFFDRSEAAIRVLKCLSEEGVGVEIVAYVRQHSKWARSAYLQWGLKHKTFKGALPPFRTWATRRRQYFYPSIKKYVEAFPGTVRLRNFDDVGDVVSDFLALIGADFLGLKAVRENVTADDVELLARATYNAQFKEQVFPRDFDRAVGRLTNFEIDAGSFLSHYLPSVADLEFLNAEIAGDVELVNDFLTASGQLPLVNAECEVRTPLVSTRRWLLALAQILIAQELQIQLLESKICARETGAANA